MQSRVIAQGSLTAVVNAHPARWVSVLEAAFVLFSLLTIAAYTGGQGRDWLATAAVFLTFLHAQLAFDFEDSQKSLLKPAVQNFKWAGRLFVTKEALWVVTFFMTGSWPLCVGSVIFATYPHWRKMVRRQLLR